MTDRCAVSMVTAPSMKYKCLLVSDWRGHREIQRFVAWNCAFMSFPNGLCVSVRPTFTNEHLFLLIPPLPLVLCIQINQHRVLCHSQKTFHYRPIKNTISLLLLQLLGAQMSRIIGKRQQHTLTEITFGIELPLNEPCWRQTHNFYITKSSFHNTFYTRTYKFYTIEFIFG